MQEDLIKHLRKYYQMYMDKKLKVSYVENITEEMKKQIEEEAMDMKEKQLSKLKEKLKNMQKKCKKRNMLLKQIIVREYHLLKRYQLAEIFHHLNSRRNDDHHLLLKKKNHHLYMDVA